VRVLVTGGFGFIGTAVVRRLALSGHEVIALTHREPGEPTPTSDADAIVRADVCDADAVRAAVRDADAVCHLAALTSVRESFARADEYWKVNATGTSVLLNSLRRSAQERNRPVRFVYASTHSIYGAPVHQPVREDTPAAPTSPYGESKAAAERLVATGARSDLLGAVCLRIFNAAGAVAGATDTDDSRLIPKVLAVAAGRAPLIEINGDGTAIRDYVHVDDVARAFAMALPACEPGSHQVYNVGATPASVSDVIATAGQVTGRTIPLTRNPPKPEPERIVADTTLIRRQLAWAPERSSLAEIVADAWAVANSR
jgi:UDP-glucose 4-epimerase